MSSSQTQDDGIVVQDFEEWMRPQVAALFAEQYGGTAEEQEEALTRFYDHPFQRNKAIRLVALDDRTVVGFQSLFYWPYGNGSTVYESFQSGRSLVAPTHRGKGIFGRLLSHLDENREHYGYDFLMGFPVEASYGSFMRNGWGNPLDLQWRVRPLHPLTALRPGLAVPLGAGFDSTPEDVAGVGDDAAIELAESHSFLEWREGFSEDSGHAHFHHGEGEALVRFDCKLNQRGRVNELIVGSVRRTTRDRGVLARAVRQLVKAARSNPSVTLLSIASNPQRADDPLGGVLSRSGFLPIRRKIYFITKCFGREAEFDDPSRWVLFRSDVDTW